MSRLDDFKNTALYEDASRIASSLNYGALKTFELTFFAGDNEIAFSPIAVLSAQVVRDSIGAHSDDIRFMCMMGLGDYKGLIIPSRDELTCTMHVRLLNEDRMKDPDSEVLVKKYKAILIEKSASETSASNNLISEEERDTFNLRAVIEVTFQLIEETVYNLMQVDINGIWRKTTVQKALAACITATIEKDIDFIFFSPDKIQYIEISPADNEKEYEQIQIETGTKILDLPGYLQHTYGMYSTGLGSYIYQDTWWIYNLYQYDWSEDNPTTTMNFFIVPKGLFEGADSTYEVDNDTINVIIYSGTNYRSSRQEQTLSSGSGVRYSKADKITDSVEVKDNKANVNRTDRVNEYNVVDTPDGVKNLAIPKEVSSSNEFSLNSQIARKAGGIISFVWEKADSSLIYPGAPCTVNYLLTDGTVEKLYGKILTAIFKLTKIGTFDNKIMYTQAIVSVYIDYQGTPPNLDTFVDLLFQSS
jgi:hypothetical protein